MAATLVLAIFLLLVQQTVDAQIYGLSSPITPPSGNSPSIIVKTVGAYQVYTCVKGAWKAGKGYATLVDAKTKRTVGTYSYAGGDNRTFSLINTDGDHAESGFTDSFVTGEILTTAPGSRSSDLSTCLFGAASHENDGAASSVSYIQFYNVIGGGAPPQSTCTANRIYSVTKAFTAEFCFWTQDSLPPSVPQQVAVSTPVLEGFYGVGNFSYRYSGSAWSFIGKKGTLHTLPGTSAIGEFSESGGTEYWQVYDPNGFSIQSKPRNAGVHVTSTGCAWILSAITSQTSSWSLGHCSYVQTVSTRGGLPPTLNYKPAVGEVHDVPVSFIVWLYK